MSPRPPRLKRTLARLTDTLRGVASGQFIPPVGEIQFVIFAHARSGSTSFVRALERHPRIRILNEPFSDTFRTWNPNDPDYRSLVTDETSMDTYLAYMYEGDVNGVKVLSYQMPRDLYAHMLRGARRRVIVLRRANLLQSVVSAMISEQTGVWHSWDLEQPLDEAYARLEPLSIDDARARMAVLRDENEFYDRVLSSRDPADVFRLAYEELFLGPDEQRRRLLDEATAFVGLEPVTDEQAHELMDPSRTKLNSDRTYEVVPNAREIDEALGGDESGHLFGPAAATA
jgi:hypothetical protein